MIPHSFIRRCASANCNAEIAFARNVRSGTMQIIDPEPHPQGTIAVELIDGVLRANVLARPEREAWQGVLWIDHHATCKNVAQFRKGKR